jgi:peptidoglycan/LPS O-acetylase OafA/YrhL
MTAATQNSVNAPPGRKPLAYLPVLDGVRGLAILLVLIHHFLWIDDKYIWPGLKALGDSLFIGVDLFFVLSGFLITRILLQARGEAHYFRNFYIRRTLRIFPLYYAFLLGMLVLRLAAGHFDWTFVKLNVSLAALPWVAVYGTNILIALQGHALMPPLNPLWSLAVEEHFYLVWPTLVRWISPRKMLWVCVGIVTGTLALRVGVWEYCQMKWCDLPDSTLSYLTVFRADALAAGAGVAIMFHLEFDMRMLRRTAAGVMCICGGALARAAVWDSGLHYMWNQRAMWMYTALALFFAGGMVLVVSDQASIGARVLGSRVMRFLGKYSYGLYIFNLPVWIFLGYAMDPEKFPQFPAWEVFGVRIVIAAGATVGLAMLSWHLLEKRCLKLKARFEPQGVATK